MLLPVPGGAEDEAILRVEFLFDAETAEGKKRRCDFFRLINGAVGQVGCVCVCLRVCVCVCVCVYIYIYR